jgi:hypothetical protein
MTIDESEYKLEHKHEHDPPSLALRRDRARETGNWQPATDICQLATKP